MGQRPNTFWQDFTREMVADVEPAALAAVVYHSVSGLTRMAEDAGYARVGLRWEVRDIPANPMWNTPGLHRLTCRAS